MPFSKSISLDQALITVSEAISQSTYPRVGLIDPISGEPTPLDHYGQTFAALAMCSSPITARKFDDALQAWLNTPNNSIDHLPFNRLALNLMLQLHSDCLGGENHSLIRAGIKRCRLSTSYPSNNWSLLAGTCRLIEAPSEHRSRQARAIAKMLQRWTTTKGAFIDFPTRPSNAICTPIAYHHKALFLSALALRFCHDAGLAEQTLRLFNWLVHCWDEAGYAGGFGRSNHSLFGDSCLISAFILLGIDECGPVDRMAKRLLRQMRPDGFLWLDPWGILEGTKNWDDYMHLSVYNAWAVAIIQSSRLLRERNPISPHLGALQWRGNQAGLHHDDEAGLAAWRDDDGSVALISTKGQPPQIQTNRSVDLRYAGGRIYHLGIANKYPLCQPGFRGDLSSLLKTPALAGPTPIVAVDKSIGSIDTYEISKFELTTTGFFLEMRGRAYSVTRRTPASIFGRVLEGVDWRFLNGRLRRAMSLRRACIPKVSAKVTIEVKKNSATLTVSECLYLPPHSPRWCVNPPASLFKLASSKTNAFSISNSGIGLIDNDTTIYHYEFNKVYDLATVLPNAALS